MIGADARGLNEKLGRVVPGSMVMGETGMGDTMMMKMPKNSISVMGGKGPSDEASDAELARDGIKP